MESPGACPALAVRALEQPKLAGALRRKRRGLSLDSVHGGKGSYENAPLTRGLREAAHRAPAVSIERNSKRLRNLRS